MSIEDHEAEIDAQTRSANTAEVNLCGLLLSLVLDGFDAVGTEISLEDDRQATTIQPIALSYNSLRWAFELMIKGAYTQSMALSRIAWESWLTSAYLHLYPEETVEAWRNNRPTPRVMRKKVAIRSAAISAIDGEAFRLGMGTMFSGYSEHSHPSARALNALIGARADGSLALRIGGEYDEMLLRQATNAFCVAALQVSTIFAYLLEDPGMYMTARAKLADEWRNWGEEMRDHAARQAH